RGGPAGGDPDAALRQRGGITGRGDRQPAHGRELDALAQYRRLQPGRLCRRARARRAALLQPAVPDLRHGSGRFCRHGRVGRPDRRARQGLPARDAPGQPRLAAPAAAAPGTGFRGLRRRGQALPGAARLIRASGTGPSRASRDFTPRAPTVALPAADGPRMRKFPPNPQDLGRLDLDDMLGTIHEEVRQRFGEGKVADYIPSLADVSKDRFGMALALLDGRVHAVGHAREPFSIQSISKVSTLTLALEAVGDGLWTRVDREPSGDPFNSLIQLEHEKGIPRNPFMNAGALVSADVILSGHEYPEGTLLEFMR